MLFRNSGCTVRLGRNDKCCLALARRPHHGSFSFQNKRIKDKEEIMSKSSYVFFVSHSLVSIYSIFENKVMMELREF